MSAHTPAALAWPAWLAFFALVMAVGLLELAANAITSVWLDVRTRVGAVLIDIGARIMPGGRP